MLPDLTILIAILVGLTALVEGPVDPRLALLGTAASVCVGVAMTWMAGERGARAVRERRAETALSAARWIGLWPLIGWFAALSFFDWGQLIAVEIPRSWWLGRYAILFAPALVLFAAGWVQQTRVEEAIATARGGVLPSGSAWHAIRQGLRRNAIALLPMFVILGLLEAIFLLGELGVPGVRSVARWLDAMPLLALGVMFALLALLSFLLPAVIRRVLPTESMPPGPGRDRLERHAAALKLRYRDLLVWKTKGSVLNAMVIGFTPRTRLIFMTDALLKRLPEEEVLAVFSHEAGHAKRHHLPLFLVLFVTTGVLFHFASEYLEIHGVPQVVLIAAHLAFLWYVLLGAISRQFEREADVYGANHAAASSGPQEPVLAPGLGAPLPAGAAWMMRSLERIRMLSGRGSSHRHGTIEDRVRYLAAYATTPEVRDTFGQTRGRLLRLIALSVLVATALLAWRVPGDLRIARAWMASEDAREAYVAGTEARKAGNEGEARTQWEQAYAGYRGAITLLRGDDSERARWLGLHARFNAADSAFHGLDDEVRGRKGFEETVAFGARADLPPEATRALYFHAYVDLGRILAHAGDAGAYDHWIRAGAAFPQGGAREAEGFYRARKRLLRAVLLGAFDHGLAPPEGTDLDDLGVAAGDLDYRVMLEELRTRRDEGVEWDELRRDARLELERLPPSDP